RQVAKVWGPFVNAILFTNKSMYVGGSFIQLDNTEAENIAGRNSCGWFPLGRGIQAYDEPNAANALRFVNRRLYVGGTFYAAGLHASQNFAAWRGDGWPNVTVENISVPEGTGVTNDAEFHISICPVPAAPV